MDWKLIWLAFGTLFLAELGDKTQLAVFTLAAQNKKPWPVFLGASLALVLVTFLGAYFGGLITKLIPTNILQLIAGLLFVTIGIIVLWSAVPGVLHMLRK